MEEGQILAGIFVEGGKTSLLRALTGLERKPSTLWNIKALTYQLLPPNERGIGMVFQNGQLFLIMLMFMEILLMV